LIRVVIDTNVYLSGLFFGGKPMACLELARSGAFRLYASPELLNELEDELSDAPFNQSSGNISRIISNIEAYARIIKAARRVTEVRDPKDNMLLDCALASKADFLVTGDKDLLDIGRFRQTRILSVAEFLALSPWL